MFKCICEKEFKTAEALNAHKSHCLDILGYDRWYKRNIEQMTRMGRNGAQKLHLEAEERKKQELDEWISEEHTCEKCGKIMTEKFGSGRFCSRACANSREKPLEVREKVRNSYLKTMLSKERPEEHIITSRFYTGYYKGVYCASSYELIFLLYCEEHHIKVERCKYTFKYKYKRKNKIYVPDFYLPESNTIVELKGRGGYYNAEVVRRKSKSVKNSNFKFKIIYDKEFNEKYYSWAKKFYNFKKSDYKSFCMSKYDN